MPIKIKKGGIRKSVPESELSRYLRYGYEEIESEPVVEDDYESMSYDELGDLMEERGLEFKRSTEDRIEALRESDKE